MLFLLKTCSDYPALNATIGSVDYHSQRQQDKPRATTGKSQAKKSEQDADSLSGRKRKFSGSSIASDADSYDTLSSSSNFNSDNLNHNNQNHTQQQKKKSRGHQQQQQRWVIWSFVIENELKQLHYQLQLVIGITQESEWLVM